MVALVADSSRKRAQGTRRCKGCGRPATRARPLSTRGLHRDCAIERASSAVEQMRAKEGPVYDRWRAAREAALRAELARLAEGA